MASSNEQLNQAMGAMGDYMKIAGSESTKLYNRARQLAEEELNNAPKTGLGNLEDDLAIQHVVKKQSEIVLKNVEKLSDPEPGMVLPDVKPTIATVSKMISSLNIPGINKTSSYTNSKEPTTSPAPTSRLHKIGDAFSEAAVAYGSLSNYAVVLRAIGTAERELGIASLEFRENVERDFIQPWSTVLNTDMKDLEAKENDLKYARVDLDSAKRKHRNATAADKLAEAEAGLRRSQIEFDRYHDSLEAALERLDRVQMEQTIMLRQTVEHQLAYHTKAAQVLEQLLNNMPTAEDVEADTSRARESHNQIQLPE
eukprot:CFRG0991T1